MQAADNAWRQSVEFTYEDCRIAEVDGDNRLIFSDIPEVASKMLKTLPRRVAPVGSLILRRAA
jgi:hypothetical protein